MPSTSVATRRPSTSWIVRRATPGRERTNASSVREANGFGAFGSSESDGPDAGPETAVTGGVYVIVTLGRKASVVSSRVLNRFAVLFVWPRVRKIQPKLFEGFVTHSWTSATSAGVEFHV